MTDQGPTTRKKIYVPPQRPEPEPTPSESGTLAGFTRQQAEMASAGDLFETIKTARQKAADQARGDAAQMAIDHAMATPVSLLQSFLQNKRALYGAAAILGTAIVFAIVTGTDDPKAAKPKSVRSSSQSGDGTVRSSSQALSTSTPPAPAAPNRNAGHSPPPQTHAAPPARPTYFPTSSPNHEADAQADRRSDQHNDDPPPLLDDFQVDPIQPPPEEPSIVDDPNMPPPAPTPDGQNGGQGGPGDPGQ